MANTRHLLPGLALLLLGLAAVADTVPFSEDEPGSTGKKAAPAHVAAPQKQGLPGPPYPRDAMEKGIQGVVVVKVIWDGDGDIDSCRVVTSSGSGLLDKNTISFIKLHWKDPEMAGKTVQTPITYRLQAAPPGPTGNAGNLTLEQVLSQQGFSWTAAEGDTGNTNVFKVEINGKPFNLLLDTGSPGVLVIKDAVDRAHLTLLPGELPPLEGVSGPVAGKTKVLNVQSLKIGGQECTLTKIAVTDIVERSINGTLVQGLLGLDFLKANHAVIVVNPPLLFLNPKHGAFSALETWLRARGSSVTSLELFKEHYYLPVHFDGYSCRMVLDTGAYFSIIKSQLIKKYHFTWSRGLGVIGGLNGHGIVTGSVSISELDLGDFAYGPADLRTAWGRDADSNLPWWNDDLSIDPQAQSTSVGDNRFDGFVGYNLVGSVYTVIDTSADRVYFRPFPRKEN